MQKNYHQTNLLLCGSSRVGKSTLINAICQQKLTKTSASLNSQTTSVERYSYKFSNGPKTHETVIWDTPGIESWDENDVRNYMNQLIEETKPLCMIYCASPGSFAQLKHVQWLTAECHRRSIFCALVCTNMWAGRNRQEIVDGFKKILSAVHPSIQPIQDDNIIYYDKVALVTMVNSQEYIDHDFNVRKRASGVEELIFGIGKCLDRDLMFAWFRTVSQNKPFWSSMSSKLNNLLKMPTDAINSLLGTATGLLDLLFDLDLSFDEERSSTVTDESLFHDAEIIEEPIEEMNDRKICFKFHPENESMTIELVKTLPTLGATACKTTHMVEGTQQLAVVTATFSDKEQFDAFCRLWQLAATNVCDISVSHETKFYCGN